MKVLETTIEELLSKLPHKKEKFRKGASLKEIDSIEQKLAKFGVGFTQELKELYSWINGNGPEFDEQIPLFIFNFYSLTDAYQLFEIFYQKSETVYWPLGPFEGTNSDIIVTLNNVHNDQSFVLQDFYEEIVLFHQNVDCMLKVAIEMWETNFNWIGSLDDLRLRYSPKAYPALDYEQFFDR